MEKKYDNNLKGALWKKTSQKGVTFLSGKVQVGGEEYWISVFKKDKQEGSNHPDYDVVLKPVNQQEDLMQSSGEVLYS
jgi:uncharacterized protein (DUF736 family)